MIDETIAHPRGSVEQISLPKMVVWAVVIKVTNKLRKENSISSEYINVDIPILAI